MEQLKKTVLMADDDDDDRLLMKEAFEEARIGNQLLFVGDGDELMDYLHHRGRFGLIEAAPAPDLILLDLNMPGKDGREALQEMKADRVLRRIPVIVLTTSKEEADIVRSYEMGASSYITKPTTFAGLMEVVRSLVSYWFELVKLPAVTRFCK